MPGGIVTVREEHEMAEIAIEKKSQAAPWWLWLILALLIIGGLIWYFSARKESAAASNYSGAAASESGAITDMSVLYNVNNQSGYVGRTVSSAPVRVLSVTGDRTFWVGDDVGRQALVLLNETPTPGQPATEGRYNVNPGQMVRVFGHVERFPGFAAAQRMWNVGDGTKAQLDEQKVYVVADRLDITQRP